MSNGVKAVQFYTPVLVLSQWVERKMKKDLLSVYLKHNWMVATAEQSQLLPETTKYGHTDVEIIINLLHPPVLTFLLIVCLQLLLFLPTLRAVVLLLALPPTMLL